MFLLKGDQGITCKGRIPTTVVINKNSKPLNQVAENNSKVDHSLNYNMAQIMIEKQNSYKSDFTKTEKDDVDFWELRVEEREHIMNQIAKNARTNRIRTWIELIFMLGFIYYMLYDMYTDGDLDTIIQFLKSSIV